ncbi:MAG: hypothetical protein WB988_15080 [Candidatus Nitrosopolaris sp.]
MFILLFWLQREMALDISELDKISSPCLNALKNQGATGWSPNYKSKCGLWACRLSALTGHNKEGY